MEVQFKDDELAEAFNVLFNHMADEAGLSDKDRAMLKRWKSSSMKLGSDDMDDLVRKANEDLLRGLARRERSQIRKPDWAD
ncbi:MAG: hypothetical protein C0506_09535 [Anaerolinea sp.]|nr:hypothetical protein [Anaerolinea sp.]